MTFWTQSHADGWLQPFCLCLFHNQFSNVQRNTNRAEMVWKISIHLPVVSSLEVIYDHYERLTLTAPPPPEENLTPPSEPPLFEKTGPPLAQKKIGTLPSEKMRVLTYEFTRPKAV